MSKIKFFDTDNIPEYDFHLLPKGVSADEIIDELHNIIEYEKENRSRIIRVIVGKGKNSKFGPVIKPIVEGELLNLAMSGEIKKFYFEKMKNGKINDGAFIVEIF